MQSIATEYVDIIDQLRSNAGSNLLENSFSLNERFLPYFPSRIEVPSVAFIVARTDTDVIGCENKLPWRMSSDLTRFRELTSHHSIIMGRKTFESIGRPLPKRFNIVVTRDRSFFAEGVSSFSSVSDALLFADVLAILFGCEKTFVIGGAEIFNNFARTMSLLFLTQIHDNGLIEGDSFFNYRVDRRSWAELYSVDSVSSEKDDYPSTFSIFRKKKTQTRSRTFRNVHVGLKRHRDDLKRISEQYDADRRSPKDLRQLELQLR